VTGATSCSEHFAQNPLEAPCCRTHRRCRAKNRLREWEAVQRRQAVSIVAPSTRAPPASATAPHPSFWTEIDPTLWMLGDGPQRPRAAKPSRVHAPQPGHRPAQPPAAAHPDRPRNTEPETPLTQQAQTSLDILANEEKQQRQQSLATPPRLTHGFQNQAADPQVQAAATNEVTPSPEPGTSSRQQATAFPEQYGYKTPI